RRLGDERARLDDAGSSDEHIAWAERGFAPRDRGTQPWPVANVGGLRVKPSGAEPGFKIALTLRQARGHPRDERHAVSAPRISFGDRRADAARPAGHDDMAVRLTHEARRPARPARPGQARLRAV